MIVNFLQVFLFSLIFSCIFAVRDPPGVYQLTEAIDHGESPTWDPRSGLLHFVSIFEGKVFSYNPATQKLSSIQLNGDVTPVIPSSYDPNVLIVGVNRSVMAVELHEGELKTLNFLTEVSKQFPDSRFNDGKADKNGRLWFGTVGADTADGPKANEGALYMITKENLADPLAILAPTNLSNGLAWNRANDKFYFIDTLTLQVHEYDYEAQNATLSNKRVAFDLSKQNYEGLPDGMTIDRDDNLWVALWGGGGVVKVDPRSGQVLQFVPIPATYVTSAIWGGPNLDVLYVTTSCHILTKEERRKQPAAGSLFAVKDLGTGGLPAFDANVYPQ